MRARNIKPGFFRNEELAECSAFARLIFPGLWMMADRAGRLEYRPKRIKAELLPYDSEDVVVLLDELLQHGLIKKYEVDGVAYMWIPGFRRHQNPHHQEKASTLPPHPEDECPEPIQDKSETSPGAIQDKSEIQPPSEGGQIVLIPDSLIPDSSPTGELRTNPDGFVVDEAPASPDHPPICPHKQIIAMYHELLPELPRVVVWQGERESWLRARWRETWERLRKAEQPHDLPALLEWWRTYFARVRASPFLMGRKEGKSGFFTTTLEWLVRPRNYANVVDGKFLDRRTAA